MNIRRLWSCVALGALALGVAAAPAAAAPLAPSTVGDVCGAGYAYVHAEPIVRSDSTLPAGTVYVQYNAYTRSFCGFAVKSQWVGVATEMSVATVGSSGTANQSNSASGPRLYSIGPSRDTAWESDGKHCVLFGASISDPEGNQYFHQSANPAIGYTRLCV
ncbi:hypothetical protein [Streptomyces sp. NPDC050388]|uniref:hypothetical protein n=1 Tax=Streptomyces sp. NPDC050388 TaxID=3155781 RepID=UPI0034478C29